MTHAFKGETDKEIAQALGNSQRTVHHQLQSVYRKLEVSNRGEAIHQLLKK
jgi:DNA-binding NarL/FixJ family response regulator